MPRSRRGRRPPVDVAAPAGVEFATSPLHRLLVGLIALKVLILIVAFDPLGHQAFELPKAQLGRAIAWPMAGVLALSILRWGGGILPQARLHAFVLLFLVANVVSAVFAENTYVALYGERGSYLGLTFLLDMLVLYLAAAVALRRTADWLVVGGAALLGFAVSVAYAGIQFLGLDPYRWSGDTRRPIGTFGSTVRFAQFLGAAFASGAAIALFAPSGRWRRRARVVGLAVAFAAVVVAGAVGSRGFFIGLGAGLFALLAFAWRVWHLTPTRLLQLGALVGVIGVASVGLLIATPAGQRVAVRVADLAAEDRLHIYATAVQAFQDRPLMGFGPDGFTVAYTPNRVPGTRVLGSDIVENSAHNWVLQTAVTLGALGLTALVALLAVWGRTLWTGPASSQTAILAALGAGGFAYWAGGLVSVGSQSVDWIPWLAFGGTAALVGVPSEGRSRVALPAAAQIALVGALCLPVIAVMPVLEANRYAWSAARAFEQQDAAATLEAAMGTVARDPGRADYWNWLGLARTLSGQWKAAGDAFMDAAKRSPYDSTFWQNLARSRTLQSLTGDQTSGGADAAILAVRRAIESEPIEQPTYELGSELLYSLGRPEMALELAVEGYERSGFLVSDALVARASKAVRDHARARIQLETILKIRESAPLRAALARVALGMGDVDAARANARRALEIEPGNPDATEVLART